MDVATSMQYLYALRIDRYLDDVDLCVLTSMLCAVLFNCP